MRLILAWFLCLCTVTTLAAPSLLIERQTPPPFGYGVGSVIHHHIEVFAPAPWRLDPAQLPTPGPVADWLEIRRLRWRQASAEEGRHYLIDIDYQIFPQLKSATELAIPALTLNFLNASEDNQTLSRTLPPWRLTASPWIPAELANPPIQPLWQPPPQALAPHGRRLALIVAGLTMLLGILAWRQRWLPWQRAPFRRALPKIRRALKHQQSQAALQAFHRALNETAGHALFHHRLAEFLERHPSFAPLAEELEQFFAASQRVFFQGQDDAPFLARLEPLCRACIQVEKRCQP